MKTQGLCKRGDKITNGPFSTNVEGDIVVTQCCGDSSFYQARVAAYNEGSYDVTKSTVDLDFVDFGDSEEKNISEVFSIKTDFLRLKFQARLDSYLRASYEKQFATEEVLSDGESR
jgi:hypothetical protein